MTDERFEQLMKQALKPEIDERDVVIQKNANNYKKTTNDFVSVINDVYIPHLDMIKSDQLTEAAKTIYG